MKSVFNNIVLIAICLFAFLFAMFITPAISESFSVGETSLTLVLGGLFAMVAIGCLATARFLNRGSRSQ